MTSAPSRNSQPERAIAIVDDDPEICDVLEAWLLTLGTRGVSFQSAEALLAQVRGQAGGQPGLLLGPPPGLPVHLDGAVLDVNLPAMNGIDLAWILRGMAPLPIVLISALDEESAGHHGVPPAAVRRLRKPIDLDTLEAALAPALAR